MRINHLFHLFSVSTLTGGLALKQNNVILCPIHQIRFSIYIIHIIRDLDVE